MTRIIAGRAGGRTIATPRGAGTRPTTDRVKESLFARLQAWGMLDDARVLDLFAGSGALGCEAASRGGAAVRPAIVRSRANASPPAPYAAVGVERPPHHFTVLVPPIL